MASHHHHHGGCRRLHHSNHRDNIPQIPVYYSTSSRCCCGDFSPCFKQSSPPNLDHLLRLIASYLQNQQQQRETQCFCKTSSLRFNAVKRQSFVDQQQQQKMKNVHVQRQYDNLLRKIDDLEFSLNQFSSSCYDDDKSPNASYSTLKDSAARVIQTHFRSYLVRRSISLRQLKELAKIKSSFLSLKSSVSGKTIFPFEVVSREATDLLLQLDSIQGRVDSMIRDGKRTLCRDLVRFLNYIDDCAAKRRDIVCKSAKDLSFRSKCKSSVDRVHVGEDRTTEKPRKQIRTVYVTSNGDEEDTVELEEFHFISDDGQVIPIVYKARVGAGNIVKTPISKNRNVCEEDDDSINGGEEILTDDGAGSSNLRDRSRNSVVVEGSGRGKTRVMKNVSFDEDDNVYKVYGDTPEASVSEGDDGSTSGSNNDNGDGYSDDIKIVPREDEGFEEEEESSSQESKEEAQVSENVNHKGRDEQMREFQLRKRSSMFSPPLPLKMEP